MKTLARLLTVALVLTACASPMGPSAPVPTTDPRYLLGTLASWQDSQDAGQADDNPADGLTVDQASPARAAAGSATVVDNGDGTVTVTRSGRHWMGTVITKVLVRQKRPDLSALPTAGDTVTTTGTETWYLGGSDTAMGTIAVTATWTNVAGQVTLTGVSRSGERLGWGGGQPHLLAVEASYAAGALTSKTVSHYSGSIAPENLLYTEEFTRNGSVTTIAKKDTEGVLLSTRTVTDSGDGQQTVRRYDDQDTLRQRAVRTQTSDGWTVARTFYRADGTVKRTTEEVVSLSVEGSTTHVVRDVTDSDGVTRRVTLDVEVDGDVFTITVDLDGVATTWTATRSSGVWTLTPTSGDPVQVDASDVV